MGRGRTGEGEGGGSSFREGGRREASREVLRAPDVGVDCERGRCDVDEDDRPRWDGVTTRVRVDGDRGRIGLEARDELSGGLVRGRCPELAAALEECRASWPRDPEGVGVVGVSGGLGSSLVGRAGVPLLDEGILMGWDFVARCRDGSLETIGTWPLLRSRFGVNGMGVLTSLCAGCRLGRLVRSRVGETRTSLVEEEDATIAG